MQPEEHTQLNDVFPVLNAPRQQENIGRIIQLIEENNKKEMEKLKHRGFSMPSWYKDGEVLFNEDTISIKIYSAPLIINKVAHNNNVYRLRQDHHFISKEPVDIYAVYQRNGNMETTRGFGMKPAIGFHFFGTIFPNSIQEMCTGDRTKHVKITSREQAFQVANDFMTDLQIVNLNSIGRIMKPRYNKSPFLQIQRIIYKRNGLREWAYNQDRSQRTDVLTKKWWLEIGMIEPDILGG